ncbi:MAG TPA: zinc ribbon domain-containing protein [Actinomycetota bacterium]|nr:zinc ribbon domain-containing protein [Actinomycetota bacterium]
MTCPNCGNEVPEGTYCVVCGIRFSEGGGAGAKRGYSAAPNQSVLRPAPLTTLFPQLPPAEMTNFYAALAVGTIVMVVLALFGLFPLAIVAAAVLVPLITVVYVYDIDVYEDEPIRVIGLTMLAGAIAGAIVGVLGRVWVPSGTISLIDQGSSAGLIRSIVLPTIALLLALVGPALLLRYERFNDVLDGVTFGVAAAVCCAGAQLLVQAGPLFSAGLRPGGDVLDWIVRLLSAGIATPLLFAGAIGAAGGVLWLRYRAPVRDRHILGPLGNPIVAVVLAAVVLVLGAAALEYLNQWLSLVAMIVLDVIALITLRAIIHLGLMQEAAERAIGPDVTCPNCGQQTPHHTFCSNCGYSFAALPKTGAGSSEMRRT